MSGDLKAIADQSARQDGEATAREIAQQPAVWREVNDLLASRREDIDAFLGPLLERPDLRVVLTGAGTSAFAGEILAPALSRRTGRRVDAVATTDIVSNPEECIADDRPTLLVSFARSGNSPESVAATEFADRFLSESHHLVLTCDRSGRLYEK
ncbi:MAG TPA: tagatose-6-phosphate ketose isomerase, partial [Rubrobacter sp.]|nr:tagatose-6-phosphate ketose isomerase [Rubrobacter sp.]